MKKRILLSLLGLVFLSTFVFRYELLDLVITSLFFKHEGKFVTPNSTINIRFSDREFYRLYEIKDSRFGNKWIPFCYSPGTSDQLKHIVINRHSAIVSTSRTNTILYYCVSRDIVYPFSILGVPGVSPPDLPPGYVYEDNSLVYPVKQSVTYSGCGGLG